MKSTSAQANGAVLTEDAASLVSRRTQLQKKMLGWFDKNARDLPWRRTTDPYAIWLSEILLQQTRVEAGTPYYHRFLKKFPTVQALASAVEEDVLALWEGLGYYSRARNLLKGARYVVQELGGVWPKSADEWMSVPGVGQYTAGAIASIAFQKPEPLVDGNVKRVFARWTAYEGEISQTASTAFFWSMAKELVCKHRPGDWNQSLMELGACVCTPRSPECEGCPVAKLCEAYRRGTPESFPVKQKKKTVPHYDVVAGLLFQDGKILFGRRKPGGMLSGMWELPGGKVREGESHSASLKRIFLDETGLVVKPGKCIGTLKHVYSHFSILLHVYEAVCSGGSLNAGGGYDRLQWLKRPPAVIGSNRKLLQKLKLLPE